MVTSDGPPAEAGLLVTDFRRAFDFLRTLARSLPDSLEKRNALEALAEPEELFIRAVRDAAAVEAS